MIGAPCGVRFSSTMCVAASRLDGEVLSSASALSKAAVVRMRIASPWPSSWFRDDLPRFVNELGLSREVYSGCDTENMAWPKVTKAPCDREEINLEKNHCDEPSFDLDGSSCSGQAGPVRHQTSCSDRSSSLNAVTMKYGAWLQREGDECKTTANGKG